MTAETAKTLKWPSVLAMSNDYEQRIDFYINFQVNKFSQPCFRKVVGQHQQALIQEVQY